MSELGKIFVGATDNYLLYLEPLTLMRFAILKQKYNYKNIQK